jgi:hypothetical protein
MNTASNGFPTAYVILSAVTLKGSLELVRA